MKKITCLYAFLTQNENLGEGLLACQIGEVFMPLINSDITKTLDLIPIAEDIKSFSGIDYKIIKFSTREDVTQSLQPGVMDALQYS